MSAPTDDGAVGSLPARAEVVIIGAGTAGLAAAEACARRGLGVVTLDRRPIDGSGAHWVNGVAEWQFEYAGLPLPKPPERVGDCHAVYLIAGHGPTRITVDTRPLLEVDMRYLLRRLRRLAREAGALLLGGVRVDGIDIQARVVHTNAGDITADWIVDATGLAGRVGPPKPRVVGEHLCAAAQRTLRLEDPAGAEAFFAARDATVGDVLSFTGIEGGFSLLSVRVHGDEVAILTGSIPALGHPSGKAILDRFVAENPWVGPEVFGGSAAIPLRRPFDLLAVGPIARIGDAACQVFSAHGSGVGPSLVAARVLAENLAAGRGVQGYAVAWQRQFGGIHASFDLFRRFSQGLDAADLARLMELGLLDSASGAAGLMQRLPHVGLRAVPAKIRALASAPRLIPHLILPLAGLAWRMTALQLLYARYPKDPAHLPAWSRRVARLFGDAPDVDPAG